MAVPCGPPAAGAYFVDPIAGHDDDSGTGSQACPFKSLTHALSLVGDAGAAVTVEIVNTGAAAPTLSQSTGEVFPITVPGGVTITAEDTTKNTPTVEVGSAAWMPPVEPTCGHPCSRGFYLSEPNARVSHLVVNGQSLTEWDYGILIVSPGTVTVDHVTLQSFGAGVNSDGIFVSSGLAGPYANVNPTIGPGVVVRGVPGRSGAGLYVAAGRTVVVGGSGTRNASALGPVDVEVAAKVGGGTNPVNTGSESHPPGVAPPQQPNPLGFGLGARAGASFMGFYAGLSFMDYLGTSQVNQGVTESLKSVLYGVEAGYNIRVALLTLRPLLFLTGLSGAWPAFTAHGQVGIKF